MKKDFGFGLVLMVVVGLVVGVRLLPKLETASDSADKDKPTRSPDPSEADSDPGPVVKPPSPLPTPEANTPHTPIPSRAGTNALTDLFPDAYGTPTDAAPAPLPMPTVGDADQNPVKRSGPPVDGSERTLLADDPKARYMVVPNRDEATRTISTAIRRMVQQNERQEHAFSREELIGMLDEAMARGGD